jgi:hypothetical protein
MPGFYRVQREKRAGGAEFVLKSGAPALARGNGAPTQSRSVTRRSVFHPATHRVREGGQRPLLREHCSLAAVLTRWAPRVAGGPRRINPVGDGLIRDGTAHGVAICEFYCPGNEVH